MTYTRTLVATVYTRDERKQELEGEKGGGPGEGEGDRRSLPCSACAPASKASHQRRGTAGIDSSSARGAHTAQPIPSERDVRRVRCGIEEVSPKM